VENPWFPVQKMIYKWWISPTNTGIYWDILGISWEYHGNIMGISWAITSWDTLWL
jgi:hypothetical protein